MPFIVLLMLLAGPRLVIFLTWLFTGYLGRAYEGNFWPFLGFLFLPYTVLCYAIAMNNLGGLHGLGMVVFIVGILLDLGVIGGGSPRRKGPSGPGTFDAEGLKRVN